MKLFVKRYEDRIVGILAGPDRILFRGSLLSIGYLEGMEIFLRSVRVLNKQFKDFAQAATEQIRAHAQQTAERRKRPYLYLQSSSASKEDLARQIQQQDQIREGLICVLAAVEPCRTYRTRKNRGQKTLDLVSFEGKCLHVYFYFVDPEFGFMHVRLQTWFPFTMQVCLNGREWLGRQLTQAGIEHEQQDNCFTRIEDMERAQALLRRLTVRRWVGRLQVWARRCNPWLKSQAGKVLKPYYWMVREDEYAVDLLFRDAQSLQEIYPRLVRHAIEQFGTDNVLRFLGHRSPGHFKGEAHATLAHRWEGVRVKHWADENSIKMYDKQGQILRVETTINNPRRFRVCRRIVRNGEPRLAWLPLRKGVVDLRRRHQIARAAACRYLDALSVVDCPLPAARCLDSVTQPVFQQQRRCRALHPADPQEAERFQAMLEGGHLLDGFRARDLLRCWAGPAGQDYDVWRRRTMQSIGNCLRLYRAHKVIRKVPGTQVYRITDYGHQLMSTALRLRKASVASLAA